MFSSILKQYGIISQYSFYIEQNYNLFKKKGNYQWLQNISSMYKARHIKASVDP